MEFKDHFSTQATDYAKYRPDYPHELFDYILLHCRGSHVAWDCGTGNGQVAVALSNYFEHVAATDPSTKQIENAMPAPNVQYSIATAEASGLPDACADLITVGQAAHWFDFDRFYAETRRVAKPGALLMMWGYGLNTISPEVDAVVNEFYAHTVGPYWPAERKHLDEEYRTIPFPFEKLEVPPFTMQQEWSLPDFVGYLSTWSSVQAYIKEHKTNPLQALWPKLANAWDGDPALVKTVTWPLYVLAGYVQ